MHHMSMRYIALVVDYDGTLACNGHVADDVLEALRHVKRSGRWLILATGRHLLDLQDVFSQLEIFDRVVLENGALLYDPATREERLLCDGPPASLLSRLRERGVPFTSGRCIVSTCVPHDAVVLDAIRDLTLDLQVIFNKGAVMVLPSGINKATGLQAALTSLQLSTHNAVGIGDGENDHALISACECGIAVENAVPTLKDRADVTTLQADGDGVLGLIDELLQDDLSQYDSRLSRHAIVIGTLTDDSAHPICINQSRNSVLVAGPSASGKSSAVGGILEQLTERGYQFCLVDPEGDFDNFGSTLSLGTAKEKPSPETVMKALESPDRSVIVNLVALPVADRPTFFASLLPRLLECRAKTARPHWIVVDEAHHLLPNSWSPAAGTMPQALSGTILITVHPEHVSTSALRFVDTVIVTGRAGENALNAFAAAVGATPPTATGQQPESGEALVWFVGKEERPRLVATQPAKAERRRHRRNYAEGELPDDRSFYFRGPESRLRLKAHNLMMFIQIADGVDDDTWLFHLRQGDYSRWFEDMIKDVDLARAVDAIEKDVHVPAGESRAQIKKEVESRYTRAA